MSTHHAHDRLEGGAAPGPVATQQRHQLAAAHLHIDAMQDMRFAIEGMQIPNAQHLGARVIAIIGMCRLLDNLAHALPSSAAASLPIYASRTCGSAETVA